MSSGVSARNGDVLFDVLRFVVLLCARKKNVPINAGDINEGGLRFLTFVSTDEVCVCVRISQHGGGLAKGQPEIPLGEGSHR